MTLLAMLLSEQGGVCENPTDRSGKDVRLVSPQPTAMFDGSGGNFVSVGHQSGGNTISVSQQHATT